jgi:hypothetical protein
MPEDENKDGLTPFQRVTLAVNNGCACACHTGIGLASTCRHCWRDGWVYNGWGAWVKTTTGANPS